MYNKMTTFLLLLLTAIVVGSGLYWHSHAARLATITFDTHEVQSNQSVTLPIEIDTAGKTINAAEVYLDVDPSLAKITSVSKTGSFFQIWVSDPAFDAKKGTISMAGGLPTPGFKGKGQIGTVTLIPLKQGIITVNLDNKTRALQNDGMGTSVPLSLSPMRIISR